MDVARLNFSHGDYEQHSDMIRLIREVNADGGFDVKILQDLAGYRIRIGELQRPLQLIKNQQLWLTYGAEQTNECIPLNFDDGINGPGIARGMDIWINDGLICLKVTSVDGDRMEAEVVQGGIISSRKNVNVPQMKLKQDILTDKDKRDIAFGVENKLDFVAQSFVRNANDIITVADLVRPHLPDCKIVSKIENLEGVDNFDEIMEHSDVILVARGDLGVSLPIFQLPIFQKELIRRSNRRGIAVITATQMLESMIENARPTRAEVSDVANAILDGTDYVMLSGETAMGRFPVKSLRMMASVVDYTEANEDEYRCK